MKNMKRTLAFLLTCVLLLTPFATIPVFAEEREEKAFWHFSYNGFEHGATAEELVVKEYYEEGLGEFYDYTELYDTWEAYVETEDGERVSGELQANTQYIFVIRVDGLSASLAEYTSLVTLANSHDDTSAYYSYHQDESCVIAKFRMGSFYDEIEGEIIFNIEGYEIGASVEDLKITCDNEYIYPIIHLEGPTADLEDKPIRNGIPYELTVSIGFVDKALWDTHTVDFDETTFLLTGVGDTIVGKGISFRMRAVFDMPMLGEPLKEMEGLDFSVEGYSIGNSFSDIVVKTENELISNISVKYSGDEVFGYGESYSVKVEFEIPEGYDISDGIANIRLSDSQEIETSAVCRSEKYEKFSMKIELPERYIKGDVDRDGNITVSDALVLLRTAALISEPTEQLMEVGDFDSDGEITVSDALAVLRLAAKLN